MVRFLLGCRHNRSEDVTILTGQPQSFFFRNEISEEIEETQSSESVSALFTARFWQHTIWLEKNDWNVCFNHFEVDELAVQEILLITKDTPQSEKPEEIQKCRDERLQILFHRSSKL